MLAELLRDEIEATTRLLGLLLREYGALKGGRAEELAEVAAVKLDCLDTLQQLSRRRSDHLRERGFEANPRGMHACLRGHARWEREQLEDIWAELLAVAAQARQQNDINGAIIAASRGHTEQTLSILRGRDSGSCVYGQDAQTFLGGGGPRRLGKA